MNVYVNHDDDHDGVFYRFQIYDDAYDQSNDDGHGYCDDHDANDDVNHCLPGRLQKKRLSMGVCWRIEPAWFDDPAAVFRHQCM